MTTPSAIYMVNVKFKHRYKLTLETGEDSGERSLYFDHLPTLDGVSGVVLSDFDVGNYGNKIAKLFQQTLRKVGSGIVPTSPSRVGRAYQ